ncbi:MAG: hypothetical protein U0P30_08755 [Vicinamibacterales bacterium]
MRESRRGVVALVAMLVMGTAGRVEAQSLGQFRWQLAPYCNVVTATITQVGAIYTLDGFDDLCGAATRAPLVGVATPNPNGTIGFGFTIATPEGTAVAVSAAVAFPGLSGPWHDSAGQTGTFAFGAASGGSPRPPVSAGGGGGVSTNTPNTFTAPQTFAAGIRLGGSRIREVGSPQDVNDAVNVDVLDITVRNEAARQQQFTSNAVATSASSLRTQFTTDIADSEARSIATANANTAAAIAARVPASFSFGQFGDFSVIGSPGRAGAPPSGPGTRLMWDPNKRALRAGDATGNEWDDANLGLYSLAFGVGAMASGGDALALGNTAQATGNDAVALGREAKALGNYSFALGGLATASGIGSAALGLTSNAAANYSVAVGFADVQNTATGSFGFADNSSFTPLTVSGANQFRVRAAGGTTFYSNAAMNAGVSLAAGGGSWTNLSDVHRTQHFRDLDGEHVLAALRAMPIREWSYRSQDDAVRHVGPTAQDFRAAFGLGADPLGIDTVDADGIALAGVQALEARTAALRRELEALRAEVARLRSRRR